jgi:hypothetical protein
MFERRFAAIVVCLLLGGCSGLLPRSQQVTSSPWQSYREAQLTFDKIIPGATTMPELQDLQLDPQRNANIAILNYSDVMRRFVPHASIQVDDLDAGVRDCLSAKTLCTGYEISQKSLHKQRDGQFVTDLLGFHRETSTTGWSFNGLILIREGVVIYKLTGGQPTIAEREQVTNPLGPIQSLGQKLLGF